MMNRSFLALVAVAGTLAIAACGDDELEDEDLTEAEAEALYNGIITLPSADLTVVSATDTSVTARCPSGGQLTLAFGEEENTESGDTTITEYSATVVHDACEFTSGPYAFTLTGQPNLSVMVRQQRLASDSDRVTGTIMLQGTVDWELEGKSGTCRIGLTTSASVDASTNPPTLEGSTTGGMCGFDVEYGPEFFLAFLDD